LTLLRDDDFYVMRMMRRFEVGGRQTAASEAASVSRSNPPNVRQRLRLRNLRFQFGNPFFEHLAVVGVWA
jgi:hypothetical protein